MTVIPASTGSSGAENCPQHHRRRFKDEPGRTHLAGGPGSSGRYAGCRRHRDLPRHAACLGAYEDHHRAQRSLRRRGRPERAFYVYPPGTEDRYSIKWWQRRPGPAPLVCLIVHRARFSRVKPHQLVSPMATARFPESLQIRGELATHREGASLAQH